MDPDLTIVPLGKTEDQSDSPDGDLTIVLLGKTGVGKSASGNTILGRPEFKSEQCFKSVTTEISEGTGSVFGKQISVVNTPGLLDSESTDKMIEDFCQDLLKSSRSCLFLVTFRAGCFTKEDQEVLTKAMVVLGDRGLEKSYLLFTGGDELEDENAEGDETELQKAFDMFDGRYHLFNNKSDDEQQVGNLLLKSGHLITEDQSYTPDGDLTTDCTYNIRSSGSSRIYFSCSSRSKSRSKGRRKRK